MIRRTSRYATRAFALVMLVALTAVLLTIRPDPTITIAVHQGVEGVPMKQVVAKFCEDLYHGKVNVVELAYDELFAAEWASVAGGLAPYQLQEPPRFDVIMLDDPWLPAFAVNGALQDLDAARLAGKGGLDDFPGPTVEVCRVGQRYYALPFTGNSQLLCRRMTEDKEPAEWVDYEWKDLLKPGTPDSLSYAMRLGPGNAVVTDFLPILWSEAPESLHTQYTHLDAAPATAAFRLFHTLATPQHWASAVTQDVDVAVSIALRSAAAGIVWNAWAMALERFQNRIGRLEFGWFKGQKPVLGAWLLAIPRNAPHPQQARQFIEYAVAKDQLELAAEFGNPPPRSSILRDARWRDRYPSFPAQLRSLQTARPRPRTPCWREVERVLSKALSEWRESDAGKVYAEVKRDLAAIERRESLNGCAAR